MAYTNTDILKAREVLLGKHTEAELRAELHPFTTMLLKNQEGLFSNLQQIVDSEGEQTEAAYFERGNKTVTNVRTAEIEGEEGSSNVRTLTFKPYVASIKVSMKDAMHNVLGPEFLAHEMYSAIRSIHAAIETDNIAWAEQKKSLVNNFVSTYGAWDDTNYIWDVNGANKDHLFAVIQSMLRANNYNNNLDIIYSGDIEILANQIKNAGTANAQNLQYQMNGFSFAGVSNKFSLDGDEQGQFYVSEQGMVAMVARIPKANQLGINKGIADFTKIADPFGSGMTFGVYHYNTRLDGNYTQDISDLYQIYVDVARGIAPLSNTGESVLFKGSLLNSAV